MLGVAERVWSTHDVPVRDQFAAWEHVACEAFAPVSLSRPPGDHVVDGLLASCAMRRVADLGVAWLATGAQVVEHSARHIAQGANGVYFLNLPLVGSGMAMQDGRMSVTGPGDLVLVNGDRPFTLGFASPFEQISIAIPRASLDPLLADPSQANCVVIKGDSGAGAIAATAIQTLAEQKNPLTAREAHGISDVLLGLVSLAVSTTIEGAVAPVRLQRFQAALDQVERRLADPELTPHDVAKELSISVSYLTKLFAEHGTSFGRTVLTRRLDRARGLLAVGEVPGAATVTQVAMACGFHDSGYFARTFRARFGVTPSEYRCAAAQLD
ncbi:helix-turn-helix domain-containing protein [Knoellia subterranea]|nr:helix-turn-helix domain-containing protein [Knoellia subterranea]